MNPTRKNEDGQQTPKAKDSIKENLRQILHEQQKQTQLTLALIKTLSKSPNVTFTRVDEPVTKKTGIPVSVIFPSQVCLFQKCSEKTASELLNKIRKKNGLAPRIPVPILLFCEETGHNFEYVMRILQR